MSRIRQLTIPESFALSFRKAKAPERHYEAWDFPKPGFELAIRTMLIALSEYHLAVLSTLEASPVSDDYVLGANWLDMLKGLRALLNGPTGRFNCGALDQAIVDLHRQAGFEESSL